MAMQFFFGWWVGNIEREGGGMMMYATHPWLIGRTLAPIPSWLVLQLRRPITDINLKHSSIASNLHHYSLHTAAAKESTTKKKKAREGIRRYKNAPVVPAWPVASVTAHLHPPPVVGVAECGLRWSVALGGAWLVGSRGRRSRWIGHHTVRCI